MSLFSCNYPARHGWTTLEPLVFRTLIIGWKNLRVRSDGSKSEELSGMNSTRHCIGESEDRYQPSNQILCCDFILLRFARSVVNSKHLQFSTLQMRRQDSQ